MVKVYVSHAVCDSDKKKASLCNIYTDYSTISRNLQTVTDKAEKQPNSNIFGINTDINILLTFDDGYLSFKESVLPLLESHNIPAILFITTGFVNDSNWPYEITTDKMISKAETLTVGTMVYTIKEKYQKKKVYNKIRRYLKAANDKKRRIFMDDLIKSNNFNSDSERIFLDWDEIRELDKHPMVTIGAHTKTHPLLTGIGYFEAYKEIRESKEILEKELGHEVTFFSYPYGGNNFIVRRLVKLAGFRYAFTTKEKVIDNTGRFNPFKLPRIELSHIK